MLCRNPMNLIQKILKMLLVKDSSKIYLQVAWLEAPVTGLTLAAKGAAACMAGNLAAGLTIGFPIGALAGAAVWLVHLIQDKIAENEDEKTINNLLKKINNKSFDINDNEVLDELKEKYKNDIEELAKGSSSSNDEENSSLNDEELAE